MTDSRNDLGAALSAARVVVGAATWLAPAAAAKALGHRGTATPLPFVLRLFGVRDVAMGLGYFNAPPALQDRVLRMGIMADAADAAAALVAHRRGHLPKRLAIPFALTALGAAAAGAAARKQ